jgi:hypothetical protein
MSVTESYINVNKLAESVLAEPEPTIIIKEEAPKPRDISLIKKPVFNKMPTSFVKKVVHNMFDTVVDEKGNWFRDNIVACDDTTLFLNLSITADKMVMKMRKDDDNSSFVFKQQKKLLIEQIFGSLSEISDEIFRRLTQSEIIETKTSETKDGKEIIHITRENIAPVLERVGWQLTKEGVEYSPTGMFICHLEEMKTRAAVYKYNAARNTTAERNTTTETGWTPATARKTTTVTARKTTTVTARNTTTGEGTNDNRKTKTCEYWRRGRCHNSDAECNYAHEELGEEEVVPAVSARPCNNFVNTGECHYGDRCRYSHTTTTIAAASVAGTYAAAAAVMPAAEMPAPKPATGFTGKANAKPNGGAGKPA